MPRDGSDHDTKSPDPVNHITTTKYASATEVQTLSEWGSDGTWNPADVTLLPTLESCLGTALSNTGTKHLSGTLDLRKGGAETGRVSFQFNLMVPRDPMMQAGPGGFVLLRWGLDGVPGTINLRYFPLAGGGTNTPPHVLVADVVGDLERVVTVPITQVGNFIQVYLEYDGLVLTLVVGKNADQKASSSLIEPPSSPNTFLFGADIQFLYVHDLSIYNAALLSAVLPTDTAFPYMLWDAEDSGVIAVLPTPTLPEDYLVFLDRGYTAGHQPANFNLDTASTVTGVTLYINEHPQALSGFPGGTSADFLTWLVTSNGGILSFPFDGKWEHLRFTLDGDGHLVAVHRRGAMEGQMSFALRFEGLSNGQPITGNSWGKTVPVLGKIPQQFAMPHTGEPNRGISILGANAVLETPKAIQVEYRDDDVRTVGKIIGDMQNRPGAGTTLTKLTPTNIFGSYKVPFPAKSVVYGFPNRLSTDLSDNSLYAYGLIWERFLSVNPGDVYMKRAPKNTSRAGMAFAAFSLDIPHGQTLRGIDICFANTPPDIRGNAVRPTTYDRVSTYTHTVRKKVGGKDGDWEDFEETVKQITHVTVETIFNYDWGEGAREFPMILQGSGDYSCLFYLLIATNPEATKWQPIPSLGVDAVKVTGANAWKEIVFKAVDIESLMDEGGNSLLKGPRRAVFKMVLAHELTSTSFQGLSYKTDSQAKK